MPESFVKTTQPFSPTIRSHSRSTSPGENKSR
jgi:hypothetical protein